MELCEVISKLCDFGGRPYVDEKCSSCLCLPLISCTLRSEKSGLTLWVMPLGHDISPLFTYDVDCILFRKGGQAQDDNDDDNEEEVGEDMANGKLHLAAAVSDSQCHHSTVGACTMCVICTRELPSQFSGSMFS